MKRTRRAALATMLGSSVLLGVETVGTSRSRLERGLSIETVTDAEASLGLIAGSKRDSVLFERPTGYPPATFDLLNQLEAPIDVDLALAGDLRFDAVETAPHRVDLTDDALVVDRLDPGESVEAIALDLDFGDGSVPLYGDRVTATLVIEAEGGDVAIEAERSLELPSDVLLTVDLCAVRLVPDVIVAVRKRDDDRRLPTLVVQTIDCASGDSSVVERIPRWSEHPFELSFPSLPPASSRDVSVDASSRVDVSIRDGPNSSGPKTAADHGDTADNGTADREREDRTLVAVDPAGVSSRSTDVVEVPLEN